MVRNIFVSTGVFILSMVAIETINQMDGTYPLEPKEQLVPIPTMIPPPADEEDDENNYYPDCEDWEEIET